MWEDNECSAANTQTGLSSRNFRKGGDVPDVIVAEIYRLKHCCNVNDNGFA